MEKSQSLMTNARRCLMPALVLLMASAALAAAKPQRKTQAAKKTTMANPSLAAARRRVLSARPLAMYYYSGDTQGLESIRAHASQMTLLAPQCYWIEKDGVVRGELPPSAAEIAARAGLPIMPLVYNKGFDRATVTAMLHSAQAQERAASYLAYLARRENAVGIQIDFENIAPADERLFTQFVRRAAARLHREGRLLSVALVPRFADGPPSAPRPGKPSSGEWSAAFDYRALGRIADFVTLMTYDHSNSSGPPGPIAGYEWVEHALDYAVARIVPTKLLMGLPLYGREWVEDTDGVTSRSVDAQDLRELLARPGIKSQWDARWRSPWLRFRAAGKLHTVWYEDRRSWTEKQGLMHKYHLRGFAAWRLGVESPEFWSLETVRRAGEPAARARRAKITSSRNRTHVR
jgi:spore germination protein YaaH